MADPELVDAFVNARHEYERARRSLVPLVERIALESVADALPGTATLKLHGEYNEDSIPVLRIQRVVDAAGSTLFDIAEGHDLVDGGRARRHGPARLRPTPQGLAERADRVSGTYSL